MVQPGMNINAHPQGTAGRPAPPALLKGAKWVRMVFFLHAAVDQNNHAFNFFNNDLNNAFAYYDPLIASYTQLGIRTLLVLNQETFAGAEGGAPWPPWGDGSDQSWATYADGFAGVAGRIAAHYKGQGVAYEIWNEGDFQGGSSIFVPPEQFAVVLSKITQAIKAQDPDAITVFGGLFNAPRDSVKYVNTVRDKLGGDLPVDAVGIHPYGKWPPPYKSKNDIAAKLQGGWFGTLATHIATLADGIPDKPLWITEVGLSEEVPLPEAQWPEAARYMKGVFNFVRSKYAKRVPVLIWFAWSDLMRNAGIVDMANNPKGEIYTTFFELAAAAEPEPTVPATAGVILTPTTDLHVRAGASTDHPSLIVVKPGDELVALEHPQTVAARLGQHPHWLQVRTPDGKAGWSAGWLLKLVEVRLRPSSNLNVRSSPTAVDDTNKIGLVTPQDTLTALEPLEQVAAKVGKKEQWLEVRIPDGTSGFVAAWHLEPLSEEAVPAAPTAGAEAPALVAAPPPAEEAPAELPPAAPEPPAPPTLLLTPKGGLNVRSGPGTDHNIIEGVSPGDRLQPLESREEVLAKLDKQDQWLNVLTPEQRKGWVAAWLVRKAEESELHPPPPAPSIGKIAVTPAQAVPLTPRSEQLNVRGGPGTDYAALGQVAPGDRLDALEARETALAKLRDGKNWVRVRLPDGQEGWTAAWLLRDLSAEAAGQSDPNPLIPPPDVAQVPDDPAQGRQRAMSFDHDPCFVRLPVSDPGAIINFSGFGPNNYSYRTYRQDPQGGGIYHNLGGLHTGLDFGIPLRTKLCSMDWGWVVYVGPNIAGVGYGAGPYNVIVRYGRYVALFGHMTEEGVLVKKGDVVGPGDPLGLSWTFNNYPHLHFEMRRFNPQYVDKLRGQAEAAGAVDVLEHMNRSFHQWGWSPLMDDHWVNPAPFFNPPLESYFKDLGLAHAAKEAVDNDNNGFPDQVIRAGETVPTAFDLYALTSIPTRRPHFWKGSNPA